MTGPTLLCDVCGERIVGDEGYMTVPVAQAQAAARAASAPPRGPVPLTEAANTGRARWKLLHRACDPAPEAVERHYSVAGMATWPDLLRRIAHLLEKRWVYEGTDLELFVGNVALNSDPATAVQQP